MSDFSFSGVYDLPTHRASAAFTSKTSEVCYGSGLTYDTTQATVQAQQAVDDFTADNDLASYLLCDCRLHSAMLKQV